MIYKFLFFDDVVVNVNNLADCIDGKTTVKSETQPMYKMFYQSFWSCVSNGTSCESLCKEFKFGSPSKLFIG